jgi:energy-coupling factor transporter ATP-binding protein EcfA2
MRRLSGTIGHPLSPRSREEYGLSPLLAIRGLGVSFCTREGTVHAVNGIGLSPEAGETLGIVGESGGSKSVSMLPVMRLIAHPPKGESPAVRSCSTVRISSSSPRPNQNGERWPRDTGLLAIEPGKAEHAQAKDGLRRESGLLAV